MAAVNPALLLRRSRTDRIANVLRRGQDAVSPSIYGTIPDVGQFGTPGGLPTNPGPIDPPILTEGPGNYVPSGGGAGGDYWTRFDPGFGQTNPSVEVTGGTDPVTGEPIPGTVATNPNGNGGGGPRIGPSPTTTQGGPSIPWYAPGYQLPSGIQDAINRGDYSNAYGQSASSQVANFIADSTRYGGAPNHMGVSDEGRTRFHGLSGIGSMMGHVDPESGRVVAVPSFSNLFHPRGPQNAPQLNVNGDAPIMGPTPATPPVNNAAVARLMAARNGRIR